MLARIKQALAWRKAGKIVPQIIAEINREQGILMLGADWGLNRAHCNAIGQMLPPHLVSICSFESWSPEPSLSDQMVIFLIASNPAALWNVWKVYRAMMKELFVSPEGMADPDMPEIRAALETMHALVKRDLHETFGIQVEES